MFFGGINARELERRARALFDFAAEELTGFSAMALPNASSRSPFTVGPPIARGAYSYAVPGKAEGRAVLAAPVDERLFFAGEACSKHDYSTAHGAFFTGVATAEQVIKGAAGQGLVMAGLVGRLHIKDAVFLALSWLR